MRRGCWTIALFLPRPPLLALHLVLSNGGRMSRTLMMRRSLRPPPRTTRHSLMMDMTSSLATSGLALLYPGHGTQASSSRCAALAGELFATPPIGFK